MVFCNKCIHATERIDLNDPVVEKLKQEIGEEEAIALVKQLNAIAEEMRKTYRIVVICKKKLEVKTCNPNIPSQCIDAEKECEHFTEKQ